MIREFRDDDAPAVVALLREVFPHWVQTVAGFRHRIASETEADRAGRWLAEDGGEVVGCAHAHFDRYSGRPDVAFVEVAVRAPWRQRGLGGLLYEAAEEHLRTHGAGRLLGEGADDPATMRFAAARGWRHTMTRRLSSLDPRSVDLAEFTRLRAEKAREGFALASFEELRDRPRDVFDVDAAASRDIPLDEPMTKFEFDQWHKDHWENPQITFDGSFAVLVDGRPVSFAMLHADLETGKADNDMTGTVREYRGRGLARLAKLASIAWAAENGITAITTENDETNAAMLALNVSLGYRPVATQLAFVRDL